MASKDIITAKVEADLQTTPYACSTLLRLSGGTANFTYRGILKTPLGNGNPSVIIKHAEAYIASNPAWAFDVIRSHYEATMLTSLESLPSYSVDQVNVTTPHLHLYDQNLNTLVMSDYPSSLELKSYLSKYDVTEEQSYRLGKAFGQWTQHFHDWANDPKQAEVVTAISANKTIPQFKCYLNYGRLEETVAMFPNILDGSKAMFQQLYAEKQEEVKSPNRSLIHGDFWSGNVLIQDGPIPSTAKPCTLTVIDWELAHLSDYSYDLGQLFAELFLLKHFRGVEASQWLISAFMDGYGPIDEDLACRIAMLFGVHLIVWPCRVGGWGEGKVMEDCVSLGNEYVKHAFEKNVGWFKGGALDRVFFKNNKS